jgi:hypothetical protein
MSLSPTMQDAVRTARLHGGYLMRYPGGYWSVPDWHGRYGWYVGTSTIQALVSRGVMEYSEWQEGKNYGFPIKATLTEKGAER